MYNRVAIVSGRVYIIGMAKEIMKSYTYRATPSQQLKVIKKAKKERTTESQIIRNLIDSL